MGTIVKKATAPAAARTVSGTRIGHARVVEGRHVGEKRQPSVDEGKRERRSAALSQPKPELEKGVQPGFHYDPVAGVRSIARVKELAAEQSADIFFSHDMDAWAGYKHAPDFYDV